MRRDEAEAAPRARQEGAASGVAWAPAAGARTQPQTPETEGAVRTENTSARGGLSSQRKEPGSLDALKNRLRPRLPDEFLAPVNCRRTTTASMLRPVLLFQLC